MPIGSVKMASGGVSFSSIPQIYSDLLLVISSRDTTSTSGVSPVLFNFVNGDSSALYSFTTLGTDGNSASSGRVTGTTAFGTALQLSAIASPGSFATNTIHVLDYANTNKFKTFLFYSAADNRGQGGVRISVGTYRSNNGITTLSVNPASSFETGSTATLYGVRGVGQ